MNFNLAFSFLDMGLETESYVEHAVDMVPSLSRKP